MPDYVDGRLLRGLRRMANGSVQGRVESASPIKPRAAGDVWHGPATVDATEVKEFTYQGLVPASGDFDWVPLRVTKGGNVIETSADCVVSGGTADIDVTIEYGTSVGVASQLQTFNIAGNGSDTYDQFSFNSYPVVLGSTHFVRPIITVNSPGSSDTLWLSIRVVML